MNFLVDIIPAKARRYVYAGAAVAAFVYAAYEASGHDWKQAAVSLATSAVTALAHANTNATTSVRLQPPPVPPA